MTISRKRYICHFCHQEISEELVKTRSVARECSSWLLVRGGVKRNHLGVKLKAGYAHNVCAEAAFQKGKQLVGQTEMWPDV